MEKYFGSTKLNYHTMFFTTVIHIIHYFICEIWTPNQYCFNFFGFLGFPISKGRNGTG